MCINRCEEEKGFKKEKGQGHVYTAEKLAGEDIWYFEWITPNY